MNLNFVDIEGNLVRDPEARSVWDKTVITFSIAHNNRVKDDSTGQWKDGDPDFFDVEYWATDPQYWLKRLGKGVSVIINGTLKQDRWNDAEGKTRSRVKIRADNILAKWLPEIQVKPDAKPGDDGVPF
jgi:single-strand DNA-binding protein